MIKHLFDLIYQKILLHKASNDGQIPTILDQQLFCKNNRSNEFVSPGILNLSLVVIHKYTTNHQLTFS